MNKEEIVQMVQWEATQASERKLLHADTYKAMHTILRTSTNTYSFDEFSAILKKEGVKNGRNKFIQYANEKFRQWKLSTRFVCTEEKKEILIQHH